MRFVYMSMSVVAMICTGLGVPFATQAQAQTAAADKGKAAYVKHGCWQCHGFEGQGGIAGPALAPNTKPLAFYQAFIRNTTGPMPPYQKTILPDDDLAALHAYLQTIPKAADYKTIPLLNP